MQNWQICSSLRGDYRKPTLHRRKPNPFSKRTIWFLLLWCTHPSTQGSNVRCWRVAGSHFSHCPAYQLCRQLWYFLQAGKWSPTSLHVYQSDMRNITSIQQIIDLHMICIHMYIYILHIYCTYHARWTFMYCLNGVHIFIFNTPSEDPWNSFLKWFHYLLIVLLHTLSVLQFRSFLLIWIPPAVPLKAFQASLWWIWGIHKLNKLGLVSSPIHHPPMKFPS